ncbi:MAG: M23 family metallopeptidase [Hespellia sp.]|nr:M23 family metallopeptidase [Hespellia sp.]
MKKEEKKFSLKGKGAAIGIVVCFVAVVTMVGAYTFHNYQQKMENELAKAEEQSKEATTNDILLPETDTSDTTEGNGAEDPNGTSSTDTANESDSTDGTKAEDGDVSGSQDGTSDTGTTIENGSAAQDSVATEGTAAEVYFDEDSTLVWPASGAILLNYSMDKMVYYSTLQQYRYNPAVIIGGKEDEEILAAASGIVESVEDSAQTGMTVKLDMGNGYEAVYGQLKDVQVEAGDYLATGELLGYLTTPTKYYSVEGVSLYFQMLKDGEPVNPIEYVEG